MQYAYFSELPNSAEFLLNGNKYKKQSTRTAELVEFQKIFYFKKRELCIVGEHSRLSCDYLIGEVKA